MLHLFIGPVNNKGFADTYADSAENNLWSLYHSLGYKNNMEDIMTIFNNNQLNT